jgi:hypothetical protein
MSKRGEVRTQENQAARRRLAVAMSLTLIYWGKGQTLERRTAAKGTITRNQQSADYRRIREDAIE